MKCVNPKVATMCQPADSPLDTKGFDLFNIPSTDEVLYGWRHV